MRDMDEELKKTDELEDEDFLKELDSLDLDE